ncbi:MAG: hypothetical protein ACOYYS_14630 [Chloroflexota bacterium]
MNFLFLFLDGVGLGADDPAANPWAAAAMPNLQTLLGGRRMLAGLAPFDGPRASLRAVDACLGVAGLPQSATGQAVLLTGVNVPAAIGYHYGPKPNPAVAQFVTNGSLFNRLRQAGRHAVFLNAYPPRYFQGIESGRRIHSAIPLAAASAGVALHTHADLYAGRALSADFTAQGWREHLGFPDAPQFSPAEAGKKLALLASQADFSLFEYWLSDFAGHKQDMSQAVSLLETFDAVLGGLLSAWDDDGGLILITSDHGNLEDLTTRHHTSNAVPALVIGAPELRLPFVTRLHTLCDIAPAILAHGLPFSGRT